MKAYFVRTILQYPDDGNHLELYNETSFRITKGSDENYYKKRWYADDKSFSTERQAYAYAIREDMIRLKAKIIYLEDLEKELFNL